MTIGGGVADDQFAQAERSTYCLLCPALFRDGHSC
jgi:hypothetical protein